MRQLRSLKKFMSLNEQVENWLRERTAAFSSSDRPFITLTYAQSWDGSITTRSGETLCFSGQSHSPYPSASQPARWHLGGYRNRAER